MNSTVGVAFDAAQTRAALRLTHEKGNIISDDMVRALTRALESLSEDPRLKLITIEGAGADFSFGASIPEHVPGRIAEVLPVMHELIYLLLDAPAVTAAVVRGRCLGGGFELALACDVIFAADDAVFGLPEIALGVFPPAASALLPLKVGQARAASAILTGATQPASAWLAAGLVEATAPAASLSDLVDHWFAERLAPHSAAALRHAAAAARLGLRDRVRETLPKLEQLYLNDLMTTEDAAEGIAAFLAKRAPRWKDQ